jgi:hypothetical protein
MKIDGNVVVALVTLGGVVLTSVLAFIVAWMQVRTRRNIDEINDAVNHRHLKAANGSDVPPKLFDLVWESHKDSKELIEWKRGYDGGPLDNGTKVEEFVDRMDNLADKVDQISQNEGCGYRKEGEKE